MADIAVTAIGKNMRLYYATDYGTPIWVEIEKVVNVSAPDVSKSINKIMSRESGWQYCLS